MTYEEKLELLHWLFPDTLDEEGEPYGIFVSDIERVGSAVCRSYLP